MHMNAAKLAGKCIPATSACLARSSLDEGNFGARRREGAVETIRYYAN